MTTVIVHDPHAMAENMRYDDGHRLPGCASRRAGPTLGLPLRVVHERSCARRSRGHAHAWEPACAPGLVLRIRPKATLETSGAATTWGVNAALAHTDLARLHADDAPTLDGHRYLPHAIITRTDAGTWRPALTYVCPSLPDAAPDPAYVDSIAAAARANGLPADHVAWIETFG